MYMDNRGGRNEDNELMTLVATAPTLPAWAQIDIRAMMDGLHEMNNSARRPTETQALLNIERQIRAMLTGGKRFELPPMYRKALQLERCALKRHSQLNEDERLEFIAANLTEGRVLLLPFTEREIISILDRAGEIVAVREALEQRVSIRDMSDIEAKRAWQRYVSNGRSVVRLAA